MKNLISRNKKVFIIIIFIIIISISISIVVCVKKSKTTSKKIETENIVTSKDYQEEIIQELNEENQEVLKLDEEKENIQVENKIEINTINQEETKTEKNIKNQETIKTQEKGEKNTQIQTIIKPETKQETKPEIKTETKAETKPQVENQNQTIATTEIKEETKIENPTNQENKKLANTTYKKINKEVIPRIINILNNEISKDTELKEYGSKAQQGTKEEAYKNTSGFTYMYVTNIEKGKVLGNYTTFEQRVRNTVGAYGTYYVYAEDEYKYDAKGLNSYWTQTLVYVYINM